MTGGEKTGRILKSAGILGLMTSVSRVLGLARDMIMASLFGAGPIMSAFVLAFTLPNLFRRLFGEGALSAAFVPLFVELREKRGEARGWHFAAKVLALVARVLATITLALLAGLWLARWAGLPPYWHRTASLAMILAPYMIFICLAAVSMGMLNALHRFALPAISPILLNLAWIAAGLWLRRHGGTDQESDMRFLCIVILVAGALQWLVQVPELRRLGFRFRSPSVEQDPQVRRMVKLMIPAALGAAITQFNVLIDRLLASLVGGHAAAALYFSERLIYLPLGLFATATATVLLPVVSGYAARSERSKIAPTLQATLRMLGLVMIPASFGLWVLAEPIVSTIFKMKNFNAESVETTAIALRFYAPGLLVFSLAKAFIPILYAHQDTRTPVRAGAIAVGVNIVLNLIFIATWPPSMKHGGIALATVLAELVYIVILGRHVAIKHGNWGLATVMRAFARHTAAAALMALASLATLHILQPIASDWPQKVADIFSLSGAILVGLIVYPSLIFIFRFPEAQEIRQAIRRLQQRRTRSR